MNKNYLAHYIASLVAILTLILGLAACSQYGESNNYNSPDPNTTEHLQWVRISTPQGYETIVTGCFKGDRIYIGLSHGVWTDPQDPNCKK